MLLPASPRTRFIGATALVIAIAVTARAFELGSQSLWTDELFTRYYINDAMAYSECWLSPCCQCRSALPRKREPMLYC
jgi:predicted membrane-bound mannosyltransferase